MDDDSLTEETSPSVNTTLEYVDGILNFYIKSFTNLSPLPSCSKRKCKAVIWVATGISRTTWMGRPRAPSSQELSTATVFRTLAVKRQETTIFNEFFSCPVPSEQFTRTLMRVQLHDVDKREREVVIAESDIWVSQYANNQFREYRLPVSLARPDLGELEITLVYLPTAQRMCIDRIKATNLRIDGAATEVYVRCWLFTSGFDEVHKTEHTLKRKEENFEYNFSKRLIYDVLRCDVMDAILLVEAVELLGNEKRVIGVFGMSGSSPICERGLWHKALLNPRKPTTAIMRLTPGL